jgi:hypothetical protein
MAKDRALDRHLTGNYPYRPTPSDLLQRLDDAVGEGRRSKAISLLLAGVLDRRPIQSPEELHAEVDKLGQGDGE